MEVALGIAVTENSVIHKCAVIHNLSNSLKDFFSNKTYGGDVEKIFIGFILVSSKPGYEDWYKEKKPRYTFYKSTTSRLTGETIEVNKLFCYEIAFSDELIVKFINGTDESSLKLVALEILKSLGKLDKLPKKIKDFDKDSFTKDFTHFLRIDQAF